MIDKCEAEIALTIAERCDGRCSDATKEILSDPSTTHKNLLKRIPCVVVKRAIYLRRGLDYSGRPLSSQKQG